MEQLSVFISYAHKDKPIARSLARALTTEGMQVWIDEGELRAGDSIIRRIARAIREVEYVVALVSANSVSSQWCNKELALAVSRGIQQGRVRLLPLRLDDVEMPPSLDDVMYLQVDSANPTKIVRRLVHDVRRHRQEIIQQQTSFYSIRLMPLAQNSAYTTTQLKQMLRDLTNEEQDNDQGDLAMKSLMKDYSSPAMETLYQATLIDGRAKLNLGFGIAGIMYLAPITAPWIRKLLMNRSRSIVFSALDYLVWPDYVRGDALEDTFIEIKRLGKWTEFKRGLIPKMAGWSYSDRIAELIETIDTNQA